LEGKHVNLNAEILVLMSKYRPLESYEIRSSLRCIYTRDLSSQKLQRQQHNKVASGSLSYCSINQSQASVMSSKGDPPISIMF
jgi:hypothetical protein